MAEISTTLGNLSRLGDSVDDLMASADMEAIRSQIIAVSETIRNFSREQGLKIEEMLDISEEQLQSVGQIRNRAEEIKAIIALQQEILERGADKPVVRTWMEIGD